jgi:hypothetical protein
MKPALAPFLSALATPRAAAIPTTLVSRDLSGLRDGTSGSPLPGAPQSHAPVSAAAFVPAHHTGGAP